MLLASTCHRGADVLGLWPLVRSVPLSDRRNAENPTYRSACLHAKATEINGEVGSTGVYSTSRQTVETCASYFALFISE